MCGQCVCVCVCVCVCGDSVCVCERAVFLFTLARPSPPKMNVVVCMYIFIHFFFSPRAVANSSVAKRCHCCSALFCACTGLLLPLFSRALHVDVSLVSINYHQCVQQATPTERPCPSYNYYSTRFDVHYSVSAEAVCCSFAQCGYIQHGDCVQTCRKGCASC